MIWESLWTKQWNDGILKLRWVLFRLAGATLCWALHCLLLSPSAVGRPSLGDFPGDHQRLPRGLSQLCGWLPWTQKGRLWAVKLGKIWEDMDRKLGCFWFPTNFCKKWSVWFCILGCHWLWWRACCSPCKCELKLSGPQYLGGWTSICQLFWVRAPWF